MAENTTIRDELKNRLPAVVQPFLTWLTGKPYSGQMPSVRLNWAAYEAIGLLHLILGTAISGCGVMICWHNPTWLACGFGGCLVAVSWVVTTGGCRRLSVQINHQIIHRHFSGNRRIDTSIGTINSGLVLVQPLPLFLRDHADRELGHHGLPFATVNDPDCSLVVGPLLGLEPGLPRHEYNRRLWRAIFSVRFHTRFAFVRIRDNFWNPDTPLIHRLVAVGVHFSLATVVSLAVLNTSTLLPIWIWAIAWMIPLFWGYQCAALFQLVSEHLWLSRRSSKSHGNSAALRITLGRLMGDAPPRATSEGWMLALAWCGWWIRAVALHLPARVGVIVADIPAHDWHHRHQSAVHDKWTAAIYSRQREIEQGMNYWDVWGLSNAIRIVFDHLARCEPLSEAERRSLTEMDTDSAFRAL